MRNGRGILFENIQRIFGRVNVLYVCPGSWNEVLLIRELILNTKILTYDHSFNTDIFIINNFS